MSIRKKGTSKKKKKRLTEGKIEKSSSTTMTSTKQRMLFILSSSWDFLHLPPFPSMTLSCHTENVTGNKYQKRS